MFGLSTEHLLIFGVVMLLFGSRKLPEVGAGLGRSIRAFKEAIDGKPQIETKESESKDA